MQKTLFLSIVWLLFGSLFAQTNTERIVINKSFPDNQVSGVRLDTVEQITPIALPYATAKYRSIIGLGASSKPEMGTKRILAPGESIIFKVEGNTITEDTAHLGIVFPTAIEEAIQRCPRWLHYDLRFKFKVVTSTSTRNKMVAIINAAPKKYLDEVAFVVAHLSEEALTYNRLPEDWSYLIDNANMIYTHADSLRYVNLVEYGDTTSGDWYTTTTYCIKQGSNYIWREIDKSYYYNYIVMPKVQQEYVAVTDNLSSITGYRTWGYFWRDYLWNDYATAVNTSDTEDRSYHNVDTWGYVAINSAGDRDTVRIDTIPRLGQLMQMPTYLWNENPTVFFFNRNFSASQSALDVLGNWASRCLPQDVTSESDYRPSEPNHIAWKHVGNCHEDAILLVAAARTALIPCIHVADMCDDHVWTNIHDGGDSIWHHYEFFRGGCSASRPYYWGMTNMQEDGGYGWKSSLVQGFSPDGHLINLSETYSNSTPCTINLTVTDPDGYPVDGAKVNFYSANTQYGTPYVMSAGYAWTDAQGKVSLKVGSGKKYYMKISHSKFGSYPTTSGQVYNLITTNATAGHTYNLNYAFPDPASSARHEVASDQQEYSANKSLQITLDARNINTASNPYDVQSSTFFDNTGTLSGLNAYVVTESDLANFRSGARTAHVEYDFGSLSSGTFNIPTHQTGDTYVVLSNNNNYTNYVEVAFGTSLVDGAEFPTGIAAYENGVENSYFETYPNPANAQLYYAISDNLTSSTIGIYDLTGRMLKLIPVVGNNGNIDIQDLAPGIYIAKVGDKCSKFIKE